MWCFHCWIPSENRALPEDGLTFSVNIISLESLAHCSQDAFTKAETRWNDCISKANVCMIKFYELFFQERGFAKTVFHYLCSKVQGDGASLIQLGLLCSFSSITVLSFFYYSRKFRPNIIILLVFNLQIFCFRSYISSPLGGMLKSSLMVYQAFL